MSTLRSNFIVFSKSTICKSPIGFSYFFSLPLIIICEYPKPALTFLTLVGLIGGYLHEKY